MCHVCGLICYLCVELKLMINTRSLSNQALKSAHPSLLCCPLLALRITHWVLVSRYSTVRSGTLTWHQWGLWPGQSVAREWWHAISEFEPKAGHHILIHGSDGQELETGSGRHRYLYGRDLYRWLDRIQNVSWSASACLEGPKSYQDRRHRKHIVIRSVVIGFGREWAHADISKSAVTS